MVTGRIGLTRIPTCVIVKEADVSVLVGRDCEGQCGVTDDAVHLTCVTHICNDDTTDGQTC